ncbi:MAG TPA: rod shape-determining protein MreC [Bacteroidetes bacterium]|nr:MAG: rod shape-determining protein MreC [Ignavibacteria bacterium GWA2_54_16]HCA81433.1 rod shape-determining protein MreC [Bacteroidota bacterium]
MLKRVYDFIILFKEYAVLSALLILSLILMALGDNAQIRHIRSLATVAYGIVQNQLSFIPRYLALRGESDMLRRMNIDLADEVSRLRDARIENSRLRNLLGLKESLRYPLIAGKVVGKNLTLLRNTLTLNVGKLDGILPHMPVINEGGLLGVVSAVSDHYSVVRIVLNSDFRASAKIERSRVDGILAWDGESLLLTNVAKTLDVKIGDSLVTSDYSSTYPPNIRVGVVREVTQQTGSLFKRVAVSPGVDFITAEDVFVLLYSPDPERQELEQPPPQRSRR